MSDLLRTKKELILETAREIGAQTYTPAEIDQLRRRLIAEHGEDGKTGNDYIADVLKSAGFKVALSLQEEAEDQYEEEFEDLLHFKTLGDAEVSVMRLDELMHKFKAHGETAAVERVLNVARLGKRRAEMIARNPKVKNRSAKKKKKSPIGSVSGWKCRIPFLIGWTCANSLQNFARSFRKPRSKNERDRQCSRGRRSSRPAAVFIGRGSA